MLRHAIFTTVLFLAVCVGAFPRDAKEPEPMPRLNYRSWGESHGPGQPGCGAGIAFEWVRFPTNDDTGLLRVEIEAPGLPAAPLWVSIVPECVRSIVDGKLTPTFIDECGIGDGVEVESFTNETCPGGIWDVNESGNVWTATPTALGEFSGVCTVLWEIEFDDENTDATPGIVEQANQYVGACDDFSLGSGAEAGTSFMAPASVLLLQDGQEIEIGKLPARRLDIERN